MLTSDEKKYGFAEMLYIVGILITFFGSSAMTLHKLEFRPVAFEIVFWTITLALFLAFEVLLHK